MYINRYAKNNMYSNFPYEATLSKLTDLRLLGIIKAIIDKDQESATTKSEWASDLIDQPRKSVMLDISLTHRRRLKYGNLFSEYLLQATSQG